MRAFHGASVACLFTLGCMGADEPIADETPQNACDLTPETLKDRTFIRLAPKPVGDGEEPDPLARARFVEEGGALKAKYTVRSLVSVYDYTCTKKSDIELLCLQDNPDPVEFCRALWANTGKCEAAGLAAALGTGFTADNALVTGAVTRVEGDLKKLKPAEIDKLKAGYNSPQTQLRGILKVKIRSQNGECRLAVSDLFETYEQGKRYERENLIGSGAKFVQVDKPYLFEDCRDMVNLVGTEDPAAAVSPGQTPDHWNLGTTATLKYAGPDEVKPASGCVYTMDTWYDYEPRGTGVPVSAGPDGKLAWSFSSAVTKGRHVGHMMRYKACNGGSPERISVSCQQVDAR